MELVKLVSANTSNMFIHAHIAALHRVPRFLSGILYLWSPEFNWNYRSGGGTYSYYWICSGHCWNSRVM